MTQFFPGLSSYTSGTYGSYGSYGAGSGYGYGNYARVTNTDINDLIRYIEDGNAKQVMEKYNDLNLSGNQNIRNRIETYFARYYGQDLTTTLEQSAGSSFSSGLKQGVAVFGLFDDGLSGDEVESMITGVGESKGSKVAEYAGGIISSALSTAAIGGALLCAVNPPVGLIVGGVIGAVTGFMKVANNDKQNLKANANA